MYYQKQQSTVDLRILPIGSSLKGFDFNRAEYPLVDLNHNRIGFVRLKFKNNELWGTAFFEHCGKGQGMAHTMCILDSAKQHVSLSRDGRGNVQKIVLELEDEATTNTFSEAKPRLFPNIPKSPLEKRIEQWLQPKHKPNPHEFSEPTQETVIFPHIPLSKLEKVLYAQLAKEAKERHG